MRVTKEQRQREREVSELCEKLRPLPASTLNWAREKVIPPVGYVSGGRVWCMECGQSFGFNPLFLSPEVEGDKEKCPHCGAWLALEKNRKHQREESVYFSVFEVCGGWQVVRHFVYEKKKHRGRPVCEGCVEAVREWINERGDVVRQGFPRATIAYQWRWDYSKEMRIIRQDPENFYCIWAYHTAPRGRVLPIIRRNGYSPKIDIMPPAILFRLLLTDHEAEWMAKTKQYSVLKYLKYEKSYKEGAMPYAWVWRIANRHGYKIKDASLYFDFIELLTYFGKDTHNPRYICPKNLRAEHDELVRRKAIIEANRRAEAKAQDMARRESLYQQTHGRFVGLAFVDEDLRISLLSTVGEFKAEGDAMHHCVFTNRYDERPDTLIFSAKDAQGSRLATIELNLDTLQVVQCRGKYNKEPERKAEIIQLLQNHVNEIRKLA